jgi:hypothetical protein
VTPPPAQTRMRRSSASKANSPNFASWVNLQETSSTPTPKYVMIYLLRVTELENALCNQDKLLCKVFRENKKLNLELKKSFCKIASLRSVHDIMSAKPCDNWKMIMVNNADLWLVHSQVASQFKGAKLELRELKAHSTLLGACTSCPLLRSDLEACAMR